MTLKVAIVLCGFYRTFASAYKSINIIADFYKADLFIATWNVTDVRNSKKISVPITSKEFSDVSRIKNLKILNFENYLENRTPFFPGNDKVLRDQTIAAFDAPEEHHNSLWWANRLRDQWYLLNAAAELIPLDSKYDLILKSRLDIELLELELLPIKNHIVIPQDIGGSEFTDHLWYGDQSNMKFLLSFYKEMQNFYDATGLDPSNATEFPKNYLLTHGIEYLKDIHIKYSII